MKINRSIIIAVAIATPLFYVGCVGGNSNYYTPDTLAGDSAIVQAIEAAKEDKINGALRHMRAGLAALQAGKRGLAAESFDAALLVIEAIYGGDETAQKARHKYNAESDKVFRGEPYERAMAYYYRGVVYLMDADYENARASFKSAFLQDSLAGNEVYRQDFAMLEYLEGWASQCNGDVSLAQEAFVRAQTYNADLVLSAPDADLLILAEHGGAPVKYTAGEHNELLKIKPNDNQPAGNFYLRHQGEIRKLPNNESIAYQAITRGGREFDHVLKGQVAYKEKSAKIAESAAIVGDALITASTVMVQSGLVDQAVDSLGLGLAADVFSFFKKGQADKTNPTADTRQWDNLPDRVAYGAYHAGQVGDLNYGVNGVAESDEGFSVYRSGDDRCEVVWARLLQQ